MQFFATQKPRTLLMAIITVSVVLRLAASIYMGSSVEPLPGVTDQISYHTLALRVIDGHGFTFGENWWPATRAGEPTAHWSYLYTVYLILVYQIFGPNALIARVLQAVLVGILQPLLAYQIGSALFRPAAGLVGAALIAGYTYFIYYSAALMTESFYISAVLAVFWFAIRLMQTGGQPPAPGMQRRLALGLGAALAAAVLLRQLFLLFVPFLLLWLAWSGRKQWSRTVSNLALSAVVLLASILPITAFNYSRFGTFVLLNTNAGFAFFWGNHPVYGTQFQSIISPETSNYLLMMPYELKEQNLNEAQLDRELLRRGINFVVADPGRYVQLSISRIPLYFLFWPTPDSSLVSNLARVTSFGILWPFMLYGALLSLRGVWKNWTSPAALLLFFCLVYTIIHVLTWTLVRYRLPVDAVLIPFAGYGLIDLYQRIWGKQRQPVTVE